MFIDKLKSRKFWVGLLGVVSPIVLQAVTGQVGWPQAAALSTAAAISYIIAQAHVDAVNTKALGTASASSDAATSQAATRELVRKS